MGPGGLQGREDRHKTPVCKPFPSVAALSWQNCLPPGDSAAPIKIPVSGAFAPHRNMNSKKANRQSPSLTG